MAEHQRENSDQRLRNGVAGKFSHLAEKGESFFIRTCGKGDFKVVNLINRSTFALVDAFFTPEKEARLFARNRKLRIVTFDDNATLASGSQERSSKGTTPPINLISQNPRAPEGNYSPGIKR